MVGVEARGQGDLAGVGGRGRSAPLTRREESCGAVTDAVECRSFPGQGEPGWRSGQSDWSDRGRIGWQTEVQEDPSDRFGSEDGGEEAPETPAFAEEHVDVEGAFLILHLSQGCRCSRSCRR